MNTYYVTFGSQYAHELHPHCDWVDPNGYLAIEANTYEQAREKAFELTAGKFAFMYEEKPEARFFPLGELHRVTVQEASHG